MYNKYTEDGEIPYLNVSANKLAKIMLDNSCMTKRGQNEQANYQLMLDTLIAIHRHLTVCFTSIAYSLQLLTNNYRNLSKT